MASFKSHQGDTAAEEVLSRDGDLVSSSGAVILQGLAAGVSLAAGDDGLAILGVRSATGTASLFDCPVGKLASKRFLALARTSIWWMGPAWGSRPAEIPGETQFLLLELEGGCYGLMLPLIHDNKFRGSLRKPRDGSDDIIVRMESGDATVLTEECRGALLVGAGRDPYELMQRGVATAAKLSGTAKHRSAKQVPPSADVFGWCTWDAFYSTVSAAGIQQGLKSLVEGGAPPKLLIIDDGWQQTDVEPEYRQKAAEGCTAGRIGSENHSDAANQVEEAVAELLSSPDNPVDHAVHATHEIQAAEKLAHPSSTTAPGSQSDNGLSSILGTWLRTACDALRGCVGQLEGAFLLFCKRLIDEMPAGSWRMRIFTALATGPFRGAILRFYSQASDHTRRLNSVKANSKFSHPDAGPTFPVNSSQEDLKGVVAHLKQQYGVQYIFAWHAMMGYWGGVSAADLEMQKYAARNVMPVPSPSLLEIDPAVAWVQPVLAGISIPANPAALHNDMHSYLRGSGIDGVKVDVQSTIGLVGSSAGSGPALAAEYHASLEASARAHFPNNQLINCMCHCTEDLYRMEDTNLARVSDDFYPLLKPSHTAHITNCAMNTLFMGEIVIPDWDMWHSKHEKGLLHATARAISGGPVYVSDRPGQHDFDLLRRLVLPDGSVLRCQLPGRPTADCLFTDVSRDGESVLKVWNANACTGAVALFNLQGSAYSRTLRRFHTHDDNPPSLQTTVSPADVPALQRAAELYVAYCDSTQEFEVLRPDGSIVLEVAGGGGCEMVTISPVLDAGDVKVAPIGLVGMLNAGGAVQSCILTGGEAEGGDAPEDGGFELVPVRCDMRIKGCGSFLCYASLRPTAVLLDGQEQQFSYDDAKAVLCFEMPLGLVKEKQCQIQF